MTVKTIAEYQKERDDKGDAACDQCGWNCKRVWRFSNDECDPKLGATADKLIAMLPGTAATKLGYGHGQLSFEPVSNDANFHVRFSVGRVRGAPFDLQDVWLLGDLSHEAAADLVKTLADWRKRWPRGRSER